MAGAESFTVLATSRQGAEVPTVPAGMEGAAHVLLSRLTLEERAAQVQFFGLVAAATIAAAAAGGGGA